MSVNGISGATPALTTTPAAITPPKPAVTTAAQSEPYTVKLTGTALAKSLKLAGQNPAQIAQKLGIDIKTVDSYLNIKVATATPTPVATPTPAPISTPAPAPTPEAKPATTTAPATPAEEAKEPAAEKSTEAAQGKK